MIKKNITLSPVLATVLVAFIGLLGTGIGAYLQGRSNLELELAKFESEIILRGLDNEHPLERVKYLSFITKAGLIKPGRISQPYLDSLAQAPEQIPRVVSQDRSPALSRLERASQQEREGFEHLLAGRYDAAIESFERAETIYPSFHSVYEISRLLRRERIQLDDPAGRSRVLLQIADNFSWGAPDDLLKKLREEAAEE